MQTIRFLMLALGLVLVGCDEMDQMNDAAAVEAADSTQLLRDDKDKTACEAEGGWDSDFAIESDEPRFRTADTCEDKEGYFTLADPPEVFESHFGCNHNTSCVANCEWCWFGTCSCRLKGIP